MTSVLGIGYCHGLFHTALQKVGFFMFRWKWRGGSYSCGGCWFIDGDRLFHIAAQQDLPSLFSLKTKLDTVFRVAWGGGKNLKKLGSVQNTRQAYFEVALLESCEAELACSQILMMMNFKLQSYYVWLSTTERLRWSRGSVLAFSTQVRGFKPGRSHRIFKGEKFDGFGRV